MSVTLEHVAWHMEDHISPGLSSPESVAYWSQRAALVRAAAKVVEAARDKNWHTERCPALYEERPQGCTCGADALTEALARLDELQKEKVK